MKHLEVKKKKEKRKQRTARRIFNFLLSVSSGDQTLRLVLDILRATLTDILTSDNFATRGPRELQRRKSF